jgi:2-iminobutanoate/2-iminopropanoate deaminase
MTSREAISATEAPAALGPYSHAVRAGDLLFCSGQLPLDPASGEIVGEDTPQQVEQCLRNLEAICAGAGTTLARAARMTVFVTDLADSAAVNAVYERFFDSAPPSRVAVQVAGLAQGAKAEIEAVVVL